MKKEICDKTMKFEDCELAILRTAVDKAEERRGENPQIHRKLNESLPLLRILFAIRS